MSFDNLWAAWRHEYVVAATASERVGATAAGQVEPEAEGDSGEQAARAAVGRCVFCSLSEVAQGSADDGVVWRGEAVFAVLNRYPYSSGHVLVLPARHVGDLSVLSAGESEELWKATRAAVDAVVGAYGPDGVNVGANLGRAAGAGIPGHLHFHVLPRWSADTNFMTSIAGVRVIPEALDVAWAKISEAWPR